MTATKMSNIQSMAAQLMPNAELNNVVEAINQSWRRRVKADLNAVGKTSLGKFDRNREDLTADEVDFVLDWFKGKTDVDLTPPSTQPIDAEAISKAVEKEQRRLKVVFDQQLKTDTEAAVNAERERLALVHQAEKAQAIEAEKTRMRGEFDAKLDAERARLEKSVSGTSDKQILSEKRSAEAEAKAAIAEAKAKLTGDFETKVQERLDKDRTERAAIWHKEKLELIAAQQSVLDRIEAERSEREAAERDEREADEKENARTSAYIKDLEARVAKIAWRQLIPKPSLYDVVNITSNIVALAGFIVLFQWVGILAFTITACTFYAIVQDVKKAHRGWSAFFGSVGAFVIEAYYSYSHLHLFEELLKGNTYPFGVAYQTVALAFTVLISGGSVYAVIMTALRSHSDAEKKRCDDIDAAAAALKP